MNIFEAIRKIAKSARAQNLFSISKEMSGIRLFRNSCDFSRIQEEYLLYLYMYETLAHDIEIDKISKHVYDKELYEDSYLLWKREKGNKKEDKKPSSVNEVKLVIGTEIKFPKVQEKLNVES